MIVAFKRVLHAARAAEKNAAVADLRQAPVAGVTKNHRLLIEGIDEGVAAIDREIRELTEVQCRIGDIAWDAGCQVAIKIHRAEGTAGDTKEVRREIGIKEQVVQGRAGAADAERFVDFMFHEGLRIKGNSGADVLNRTRVGERLIEVYKDNGINRSAATEIGACAVELR